MITILLLLLVVGVLDYLWLRVPSKPCPNAVYQIVLEDTSHKFPQYNEVDIWVSHNYDTVHWKPLLDAEQAEIDRIRAWSKTLSDPCFRKQYASWLDFYQNGLDAAWSELVTQALKKDMDGLSRGEASTQDQVREYRQNNSVPQPPLER